jgi:hypothetical protein
MNIIVMNIIIPLVISMSCLHSDIPTTKGIDSYVINNKDKIIQEYQKFVRDSLGEVCIETDSLNEYSGYDSIELGRFYEPDEIIISNQEKYIAYQLSDLSKSEKRKITESNRFVKAIIIHELTHLYFLQIKNEVIRNKENICHEYSVRFVKPKFGTGFIEEGICEYVVQKMNESIISKKIYIPKTTEEIINPNNLYAIKFIYSSYYVKNFLDAMGLKNGIKVLIKNKPPTYDEILNPNLFFARLNYK